MYIADLIDITDYKQDYERYTAMLAESPQESPPHPDFEAIQAMLSQDFRGLYAGLSREEQQVLWRSIISDIRADSENRITGISFL